MYSKHPQKRVVVVKNILILSGPCTKSKPQCLHCFNELSTSTRVDCRSCGYPFCSIKCTKATEHRVECSIFRQTLRGKLKSENVNSIFDLVQERPKKLYKRTDNIIVFHPTHQNTLYLLHLFYSENDIIIVCSKPAICTFIGWVKSSCLFNPLSKFCEQRLQIFSEGVNQLFILEMNDTPVKLKLLV